ncbi:MAG: hypothetical protein GY796_30590 [Chloroflexi bacterium]|nr:hypothetical protein [Chloroflexota bacterium]
MQKRYMCTNWLLVLSFIALLSAACSGREDVFTPTANAADDKTAVPENTPAQTEQPAALEESAAVESANPDEPQLATHPRLWVRDSDLIRLRSWANTSNPMYANGLALLAAQAKTDMDNGIIPAQDSGEITWEQYPTEMIAQLFAFMSLIENDQATRDDYAQRARTLLMYVMNEAAKGTATGQPFRDPDFSTYDRSRWWGEGFPLTVDWIYPYLSAQDKATIRQVFLRWTDENMNAAVTSFNHPEPIGVVNDPILISDTLRVRWSANNYYMAHMRQIGLMSMALDPADDPGGTLGAYLESATGAWLYMVDHMLRTEGRGGLSPEGWLYGPDSLGYTAQFLLALHTAGEDNPADWGAQVDWSGNPFWDEMIPAHLHSLSPRTEVGSSWLEDVYRPAWYGDGQEYWAPDFIGVFGPMGIYDTNRGATARLNDVRWLQTHTPPGGESRLLDRVNGTEIFRDAIMYFMLFDPNAVAPSDPHAGLQTDFIAPGFGRILARTNWSQNAAMLSYLIGWINIDHQLSEGNQFGFYRDGEWLTKSRVGWDGSQEPWGCNIGRSDYHNNLALENDPLDLDPSDYLYNCYRHGSEYMYTNDGGGKLLAHSFGNGFVYALGDATNLYNASDLLSDDILHASRSLVWLQPDHIVVYDRATSQTNGRYKRFWLNLPNQPTISGNQTTAATDTGQQLFVTTMLPANAAPTAVAMEPFVDEVALDEPMQHRLKVEASGSPANVRFLNVLQGANTGAAADGVTLVESSSGTPFAGVVVDDTAVLFPVDLAVPFANVTYNVPASTQTQLITGLTPGGSYDVITQTVGNELTVTITPGSVVQADSGGVLVIGGTAVSDSNIFLPAIIRW